MFHEIEPMKLDNAFTNREPGLDDFALVHTSDGLVLVREKEELRFPYIKELFSKQNQKSQVACRYGFAVDGKAYFVVLEDVEIAATYEVYPVNELRALQPMHIGFIGMLGKQLLRFFRSRKYCGCCGSENTFSTTEQAMICPKCKHVEYPKISPAIIVAIVNGDKLLMTKYARGDYLKYALVAGFVEFGESFEQAVIREVQEEVGLQVKNIRYYKNQPWPYSDSQMVGFFAELDGDDKVTLQEEELSEAVWFTKEEIPRNDNSVSISYELIEAVRRGDVTY